MYITKNATVADIFLPFLSISNSAKPAIKPEGLADLKRCLETALCSVELTASLNGFALQDDLQIASFREGTRFRIIPCNELYDDSDTIPVVSCDTQTRYHISPLNFLNLFSMNITPIQTDNFDAA